MTHSEKQSGVDTKSDDLFYDAIAPAVLGRVVVGYCPEIHGPRAKQVRAEVTAFELELLCRHWAEEILSIDEEWAYLGMAGSREIRVRPYANGRLARFERYLGANVVKKIVDEVYADFNPPAVPMYAADFPPEAGDQ